MGSRYIVWGAASQNYSNKNLSQAKSFRKFSVILSKGLCVQKLKLEITGKDKESISYMGLKNA